MRTCSATTPLRFDAGHELTGPLVLVGERAACVTASGKDPSLGGDGFEVVTRGVSRGAGEPIAEERGDRGHEVVVDAGLAREVVPGALVVVRLHRGAGGEQRGSKSCACDTGIAPSAVPCSTSAGGFQPDAPLEDVDLAARHRGPRVLHPSYLPDTRTTGSRRPSLARRAAMPAPRLNPTMAKGVEAPSTS